MLVALLSGQRCQTVHGLTVSGMMNSDEITKLLKTSKPGKHQGQLEFKAYPVDKRLCVVACLKQDGLMKALFESFMTNPFSKLLTLVKKFFHYTTTVCVHIALKSQVTS